MAEKSFPTWLSFENPNNKKKKLPKLPKLMKKTPKPRKKALIIGINYIGLGRGTELKSCVNDAKNIRNFLLKRKFKDTPSTMLYLVDNHKDSRYHPTHGNILKAFRWLVAGASPGDTLFFQYSWHGKQLNSPSEFEADGIDEGIYPSDFKKNGVIPDTRLRDELVLPLPEGCRLFASIDCCTSGTMLDLDYNWGSQTKKWTRESKVAREEVKGDVVLFASCQENENSIGRKFPPNKNYQGLMTAAFISCVTEGPHKTIAELMKEITIKVKKGDNKQNPQLSSSKYWDPNDRTLDFDTEYVHTIEDML